MAEGNLTFCYQFSQYLVILKQGHLGGGEHMNINQDVERSLQLKAFAKNGPKWGVSREVE